MTALSYDALDERLRALLAPEHGFIANAANFAAFVYSEIPDVNWAGFYLATPANDLLLGPFCGRPACTLLPAERGVCGAAASRRATLVVDDVAAFAGHIVCDIGSRSEIVVPLLDGGTLCGVFDCDSPILARFTDEDRAGIERLVRAFSELVPPPAPAGP
ncbi:MAG TPA: GAF domain-containing protein [Candidatus Binatia bacterium]|nr:GAF domain-containing protein [Candidatus Binatia bacterium]